MNITTTATTTLFLFMIVFIFSLITYRTLVMHLLLHGHHFYFSSVKPPVAWWVWCGVTPPCWSSTPTRHEVKATVKPRHGHLPLAAALDERHRRVGHRSFCGVNSIRYSTVALVVHV